MTISVVRLLCGVLLMLKVSNGSINDDPVAQLSVNEQEVGEPYSGYAGVTLSLTCTFSISPPSINIKYIRFLRNINGAFVNLFEYTYTGGITPGFGRYEGGVISGYLSGDESSYTILIPTMVERDSGVYQCVVSDVNGRKPRLDPVVSITLTKAPPCDPNPCYRGTCLEDRHGYICACDEGYMGTRCEQQAPCHHNPCVNGICTEKGNDFECKCNACFTGVLCDEVCNETDGGVLKGTLALFVITTIVLAITAACLGVKLKRARRQTKV